MKEKPLVSICLPSYNGGLYIKEAIESAVAQTYQNIEIVICEDLSTDNSWDIICSFTDKRIKASMNKTNHGLVGNFREVLRNATGKYIIYLCIDDLLYADSVEKLVKLLEDDAECNFAFGNVKYIGDRFGQTTYTFPPVMKDGLWIEESIKSGKNLTYLIGSLFRRSPDNDFDDTIVDLIFFDWYLWLRLGRGKVAFTNDLVGKHRYHTLNQTKQLTPGFYNNYLGLKKMFALCFHDNIITKKQFTIAIDNLTLRFASTYLDMTKNKEIRYFDAIKKGNKFCYNEGLSPFKLIPKFLFNTAKFSLIYIFK